MSDLTPEQIAAIEAKYQAELVGPMSKNYDGARYAARALIEKRFALGELTADERSKALQDEFDSGSPLAMGGGDLSLHFNVHPLTEEYYQSARPRHLPSLTPGA